MLAALPGAAQDATHVRSVHPDINRLIASGAERSATFRELVRAIDASDSYVYVRKGSCRVPVPTCLVGVSDAGSARFLWVLVDVRRPDTELIALIGHELRHTLEVIGQPAVRNNADFYFFYRRNSPQSIAADAIETSAAIEAGRKIREEVLTYERRGGR
jgi:hypothetical protein